MQSDVGLQYQQVLDESHHGRPTIIEPVYTGNRGCPRLEINQDFLQWAYAHRSTSGIARYLHIDRDTVRNALLDYSIAAAQSLNWPQNTPKASTLLLLRMTYSIPTLILPAFQMIFHLWYRTQGRYQLLPMSN